MNTSNGALERRWRSTRAIELATYRLSKEPGTDWTVLALIDLALRNLPPDVLYKWVEEVSIQWLAGKPE